MAAATSYATLDFMPLFVWRALAESKELVEKGGPSVLFVCVHNAGRSQMAAGYSHTTRVTA